MAASTIAFFGRGYRLTVKTASGPDSASILPGPFEGVGTSSSNVEVLTDNSWEPEALRITFDILESTLPSPFWFSDITIYNLNDTEIQNLLYNATWATLEAGYQAGPAKSSVVWDGPVLQVLFDRDNVVDFGITLHCIASIPLLNQNIVNFAQGPFSSQLQLVSRMVSEIGGNYSVKTSDTANSLLSAKQYPRGKTCFGRASKYINQLADDNFMSSWMDGINSYISEIDSGKAPVGAVLTYSPPLPLGQTASLQDPSVTPTVIGVPKQTPFGVIFRVLLDPRLKVKVPPQIVRLDRTVISQTKVQIGQVQTPLDPSLEFVAAQIRPRRRLARRSVVYRSHRLQPNLRARSSSRLVLSEHRTARESSRRRRVMGNTITPLTPTQLNAAESAQYKEIVKQALFETRVAVPAIIKEFDAEKQVITAQVAVRELIRSTLGPQIVDIAPIYNVPIVLPRGGGLSITVPIAAGDECLLIFTDNCFDLWWARGGVQDQFERRRQDITDCFAIL